MYIKIIIADASNYFLVMDVINSHTKRTPVSGFLKLFVHGTLRLIILIHGILSQKNFSSEICQEYNCPSILLLKKLKLLKLLSNRTQAQ